MLLLTGIVFLFMGIVIMIVPELLWQASELWKSDTAAKPTGIHMFFTRIAGLLWSLVGIAGIMMFFMVY